MKLRRIVFYILLFILSLLLCRYAHTYADSLRTSSAWGGEVFLLLIPYIVWNFEDIFRVSQGKKGREKKRTAGTRYRPKRFR